MGLSAGAVTHQLALCPQTPGGFLRDSMGTETVIRQSYHEDEMKAHGQSPPAPEPPWGDRLLLGVGGPHSALCCCRAESALPVTIAIPWREPSRCHAPWSSHKAHSLAQSLSPCPVGAATRGWVLKEPVGSRQSIRVTSKHT